VHLRRYGPIIARVACWASLFCVFLVLSLPIVGPNAREGRVGPFDANQSTDMYLRGLCGLLHGSETIAALLDKLPAGKPVVIFVHAQDARSGFLGMLIGYLAWPRQIQIVNVQSASSEREVSAINPALVAGLVFCFLDPPSWLGHGISAGSGILIVPALEPKTQS
jgi:hypothetical protein